MCVISHIIFSIPGVGCSWLDPVHPGRQPGRAPAGRVRALRQEHKFQDLSQWAEAQEAEHLRPGPRWPPGSNI